MRACARFNGGTRTLDIDLGLGIWVQGEKVRLYRINAPEVRGSDRETGLRSRDFLRETIDGRDVLIETNKDAEGKYARYLAEMWLEQPDGSYANVKDLMVSAGHAEYRGY